ncbi:hypothetical protein SAMN02745164_00036 [Marinitoga hydrogenitolerans DSM 16785]|uniref:Uncharacterized protein n=1 Tax=Marinitoga hydrogenitolerans (strain DSM 16785 / JCM 12826 / AT1271) TaxID=1122195 RepID=A0A1M4S515_MARH1|nr:hypothetical protein [Marinitoga hydrogenitolerans]SHE27298.1 hypothetical protein SAMN02745164_00036 [Marinitoga hydrogenitolerans DSM 16785]
MKKYLFLILIIFITYLTFGRVNNIYIEYNYDFWEYGNNSTLTNIHSLYLGYDFGNIPLKLQIGSQNDLQFSSIISTFASFGKIYIEPYLKYTSEFSLGIKMNYSHFYLNYYLNKNLKQILGIGFNIPLLKFGKDDISYIKSENHIKATAGKKIKIKLIAKSENFPSENVDIYYNINDGKKFYAGKTNAFGEIELILPIIYKTGNYKINIFNGENLIKQISLDIYPDEPYKVNIDFNKDIIFTDNQEILKIRNIRVFDKYSNMIKNIDIQFINFKFLGDYKKIKYSYLDNTLILDPFKKSGMYNLYFEVNINGKYINGIKTITVKNNPKDIEKIEFDITYLGKEGNYAVFEIKKPNIIFLNSQNEYIDNFFIYYKNKKILIKNNRFKISINDNFPNEFIFDTEIKYYNYNSIIQKKVIINN